jgi:hypothetical protein
MFGILSSIPMRTRNWVDTVCENHVRLNIEGHDLCLDSCGIDGSDLTKGESNPIVGVILWST